MTGSATAMSTTSKKLATMTTLPEEEDDRETTALDDDDDGDNDDFLNAEESKVTDCISTAAISLPSYICPLSLQSFRVHIRESGLAQSELFAFSLSLFHLSPESV